MSLEQERDFDRSLREWAAQPSATTPEAGAQRVLDRLDARRHRFRPWVVSTAIATAGLSVLLILSRPPIDPENGNPREAVNSAVSPGNNQVLFWLDSETPLYLVFPLEDD